jgi:hypothetical protein
MSQSPTPATPPLLERIAILAGAALFLVLFNRTLPDGDALRVVRQIDAHALQWNPNHLLFDPLGFAWHWLLGAIGLAVAPLQSFEWISGLSTLVSLWLFHRLLCELALSRFARLIVIGALFASASFMVTAIGQYFFMVQMPFLLGGLLLLVKWLHGGPQHAMARRWLLTAGMLMAVATALMFNNLLLVLCLGVILATVRDASGRPGFAHTFHFAVGAAVIGIPVFVAGYLFYPGNDGFFQWLLSYQGEAGSGLNELYGTKATLSSMLESAAQVVYNLLIGNQLETAGLGPVLSVLAFGKGLEFEPSWTRIFVGAAVAIFVGILTVSTFLVALRDFLRYPLVRMLVAWIAAYSIFNFLWSSPIEIFWFQVLPAVWLLAASMAGLVPGTRGPDKAVRVPGVGLRAAATAFVVLLFAVNTVNAVVPVSLADVDGMSREHRALLRAGDLEILPGWDQQKWIYVEQDEGISQFVLMNAAAFDKGAKLRELPAVVDAQLRAGRRVIVARLYDRDADMMPWYSLEKSGWPRARLQELLAAHCNRVLGRVSDITFRELYLCEPKT